MDPKKKIPVKFEDIKQDILDALSERRSKIEEPVTLLEGFVSEPFRKEISSEFVIGGPTVPMVVLLGRESGQLYLFALKAILPDIEI